MKNLNVKSHLLNEAIANWQDLMTHCCLFGEMLEFVQKDLASHFGIMVKFSVTSSLKEK